MFANVQIFAKFVSDFFILSIFGYTKMFLYYPAASQVLHLDPLYNTYPPLCDIFCAGFCIIHKKCIAYSNTLPYVNVKPQNTFGV